MFTGIIERIGKVVSVNTASGMTQLIVETGNDFETKPGDSVAVNGCCLTITSNKVQLLAFDVSRETLAVTSLSALGEGDEVNLERAMKLGDRLGGHIVSGHVDGIGTIERIYKKPDGWELWVTVPQALGRYVIHKGSICLEGVSLTINHVDDRPDGTLIGITLIPTTVSLTSFKNLKDGDKLNVEVDTIGKFVERLTKAWPQP